MLPNLYHRLTVIPIDIDIYIKYRFDSQKQQHKFTQIHVAIYVFKIRWRLNSKNVIEQKKIELPVFFVLLT